MSEDLSKKKHVYDLECKCGHNHTREFILKPISFLAVCPVCGSEKEIKGDNFLRKCELISL